MQRFKNKITLLVIVLKFWCIHSLQISNFMLKKYKLKKYSVNYDYSEAMSIKNSGSSQKFIIHFWSLVKPVTAYHTIIMKCSCFLACFIYYKSKMTFLKTQIKQCEVSHSNSQYTALIGFIIFIKYSVLYI